MDSNKTITATFTETPLVYYILTINKVGNGTVTPASGNTYLSGTIVNIEAKPDTGWQFKNWSEDLSSTSNKTTITMNSNKTITATFTIIPSYILTINKVGNGTITPASGSSYPTNTIVNIEARPDNGWQFKNWSGDFSSTTNKTTITMNSNKTITATFTPIITVLWTAYDDLGGTYSLPPTYPNVNNYHTGNSGYLTNYATGATLGISVSVAGGTNQTNTPVHPTGI